MTVQELIDKLKYLLINYANYPFVTSCRPNNLNTCRSSNASSNTSAKCAKYPAIHYSHSTGKQKR